MVSWTQTLEDAQDLEVNARRLVQAIQEHDWTEAGSIAVGLEHDAESIQDHIDIMADQEE